MTYELVPPGDHHRNMAKRAIQTFKDYLVGESIQALELIEFVA